MFYVLTGGSDVVLLRTRVDLYQMSALIATHATGCPPIHTDVEKAIPVTIPHVTMRQSPEKKNLF